MNNTIMEDAAKRVARRFLPDEPDVRLRPLGQGLINETRLVEARSGRFVLQRINGAVFADPEAIAANLLRVQDWLRGQAHAAVRLPQLLRAANGEATLRDADGHAWRLMEYIENSRVLRPLENRTQAAEVGRALGRFHVALAELDPGTLCLTLPDLHDTPRCKVNLESALASARQADTKPADTSTRGARAAEAAVMTALEHIEARAALIPTLQQARMDRILLPSVTHGDPKLDNVLFARDADRALCLIDLDTVQPGLRQHDIADCLRSCCNRVGGGGNAPLANFDLNLCRALLGGYAELAAPLFDRTALAFLYPAIQLIPLELAMRFLADYLQGDRYFRVHSPRQNLDKTLIQLALVADIEAKRGAIERIISDCFTCGQRRA